MKNTTFTQKYLQLQIIEQGTVCEKPESEVYRHVCRLCVSTTVGSTVVRVGVSADVEALSLTGAENTEHWTDGDCIGCSTALPSPTVPATDDETTQTLDLILHHTKLPPYLN